MKEYSFLNKLFKDKDILYIPIISCINRDTNEYNLSADGNVNRFITTFSICNSYKSLTIALPSKHIKGSEKIVQDFAIDNNVNIIWCNNFGIHAGEQRNDDNVVKDIFYDVANIKCDICIFESQKLGISLMLGKESSNSVIHIFWNPVSKTDTKTRIFLEGYEDINSKIMSRVDYTIVASPDQIKYYHEYENSLIYLDKLIDRKLSYFDYNIDKEIIDKYSNYNGDIFYLPFRLTDEGYKFDKVLEYINKNHTDNYIILYSDPNNSHTIDKLDSEIKERFIKVDSSRDTYYTILDYTNCIIPYFEDLEFINHAAIHEFMDDRSKCKVILYNQNNNPYNVNNCNRIINICF